MHTHEPKSRSADEPTAAPRIPDAQLASVLSETLAYARERDYTGWDYGDGMSSRVLRALPVNNRWLNLAVQETIKRAPVNIRPLMLVEQRRNFKGTALFALANLHCDRLAEAGHVDEPANTAFEREARTLADWLVDHRVDGYSGFCGAHRHRIQHLKRMGYPDDPDVVSTVYGVKALLAAAEAGLGEEYERAVRSAPEFVFEDLEYTEIEEGARIKYVPAHTGEHYTLNAVALGAVLLLELHDRVDEPRLQEWATALLDYVVSRQTDVGGWMYRDPPDSSHLSMDNHHNGFVIESLLRYHELTGTDRYADALADAMPFYREQLFEPNGAPNWDESDRYPKDIHGAAQGIVVFSRVGDLDTAGRIASWTLSNLYGGDGRFYFQKRRFYTKRITLMRWCQGWMSYALSVYLARRKGLVETFR